MSIYFSQLPTITPSIILKFGEDLQIEVLVTDSRKIANVRGAIFFAIKSNTHDGHQHITEIYNAGVKMFVLEEHFLADFEKLHAYNMHLASVLVVKNSIVALQALAKHKRIQYHIPIIAITGSNGKTIVKEWLSQVLNPEFAVIKSPRSYNSQIGVPLSVWQMNDFHTLGVFEAGISQPNEMQLLQEVLQPTMGIFTNIGTAHDEGFENETHKISEKLKLFKSCKVVFYCKNHLAVDKLISQTKLKTISWSYNTNGDYTVEFNQSDTYLITIYDNISNNFGLKNSFLLPFHDTASIENVIHCIIVMLYLGLKPHIIQKKISLLKPVFMRLELKAGINNCQLIDDSYNNDLAGLTIALDFLRQQNQKTNKTLVLSDLQETGMDTLVLYQTIADLISAKGVNKLVAIGEELKKHAYLFKIPASFFSNTDEFIQSNPISLFSNELVLIKGARTFLFEKIAKLLQQQAHRTVLEINLDALSHNLKYYRSLLKPTTKIMVMVKSFAYGAGSLEVANLLQFHKVDYLAVAYTDEGIALRNAGISLPIMVMNVSEEDFDLLLEHFLEPVIYSVNLMIKLVNYLANSQQKIAIHVEIETGMNRLGIDESEKDLILVAIKNNPNIVIKSIFSHLAGADHIQFAQYSHSQIAILTRVAAYFEKQILYKFDKHILNSAGVSSLSDFQFDMIRLGIGLYGVDTNGIHQANLKTVGTLTSTISQIKTVKQGETIGYSRRGKAAENLLLGIIAIGYGDGLNRKFSNGVGKVWINGHLAPIIGNVCMDMTMINLTGIVANEGDKVIIFGKERNIIELSTDIDTIPYEILTGISERVKRVFFAE